MAYTTVNKSTDYFETKLYTGSSGTVNVTGLDFQPDFVWTKNRSTANRHALFDAVRGVTKRLRTDGNDAEVADADTLTSFNSDGFTVGADAGGYGANSNGHNYLSLNWKAGGSGSANTAGTINSTVSVNTTSKFSIVRYQGNGTGNSTVGHGLGVTPDFIIVKNLTTAQSMGTYSPSFVSASDPGVLYLNSSGGKSADTNVWGTSASFNNNTFTVGDWNGSNQNSSYFVAYCFSNVTGYQRAGKYTGNGGTSNFVYLGFKPAFFMLKSSTSNNHWVSINNKSDPYNFTKKYIHPSLNTAESSASGYTEFDFVSNGVHIRRGNTDVNSDGNVYIYYAVAEAPLVGSNNVPCNAR